MSQDIRSFFGKAVNKKPAVKAEPAPSQPPPKKFKQKNSRRIESDDEDSSQEFKSKEKKVKTVDTKPKIKEVSAADVFGSGPVKRIKANGTDEAKTHNNDSFANTLKALDVKKEVPKAKTPNKSNKNERTTPKSKSKDSHVSRRTTRSSEKKKPIETKPNLLNFKRNLNDDLNNGESSKRTKSPIKSTQSNNKTTHKSSTDEGKSNRKDSNADNGFISPPAKKSTPTTPKQTPKSKKPETPELTDEERHMQRMQRIQSYQNYRNRTGPKNLGSKQIPEGAPNCLSGCVFMITGVLDSFEKDDISAAIKKYGGEFKTTFSKKITHLISGEDSGPKKIESAEKAGIPIINEDQFLNMIASGVQDKPAKPETSAKRRQEPTKRESPRKKLKTTPKKEPEPEPVEITPVNPNSYDLSWVEKYRPKTTKQIIGMRGDSSAAAKLTKWLSDWYQNRLKKHPAPSPWAKGDGGYYKAVLLSGTPGIGKTTTATVVSKELGFDIVEFNASDTRSKSLIKDQMSSLTGTNSLSGFMSGKKVTKKRVVIMDEADGMAGNEDRGGMQELISLIKSTQIPIICICNDKTSQKMRSLINHCYEISFVKPKIEQIKAAMMSICFKEGIKIPPQSLEELIKGSSQDVRQILNVLSVWTADSKNLTDSHNQIIKKDIKMGPWSALKMVFSEEDHKNMTIRDKSDLFFHDYSLMPLFVQHNYIRVTPNCPKKEVLDRLAAAADSLSFGDTIENRIRGSMAWSLLPQQAMFSCVIPGTLLSGHCNRIDFPGWLGQNSKTGKFNRLIQELHAHTRLSTSGSKSSIRLDYASHLRDAIVQPLIDHGSEGVNTAVETLQAYNLLREDLDSLLEYTTWSGSADKGALINSKVKAAMTKKYNKEAAPLPYSQISVKKGSEQSTEMEEYTEQYEATSDKESDVEGDGMIKVLKPSTKPSKPSKAPKSNKPSTSRKKGK